MASSVRISKQFGVNPSVETCACCGKQFGVVLFGTSYMDVNGKIAEVPMNVCMGNLCNDCKAVIEAGRIFFIEVRDGETGNNPYRTGRLVAVKEKVVQTFLNSYGKINYMEHTMFESLFGRFVSCSSAK